MTVAVALEKSNLGSLRDFVYKDQYGNPISALVWLRYFENCCLLIVIADPDLANPTRPRLERPLETIRSFEAAIYGKQSVRPASFARTGIYLALPFRDD